MDFPRPSKSPSDLIGGLKDRFGFGGGQAGRDGYDQYADEPYDDYEQYAPAYEAGGAVEPYDPDTYGDPYDRLEYTSRPTSGRASSSRSSASRALSPQLVDAHDIRATTSVYGVSAVAADAGASSFEPASSRRGSETQPIASAEGFDVPRSTYHDFVSPYQGRSERTSSSSAGLDSLFEPTTVSAGTSGTPAASSGAASSAQAGASSFVQPVSSAAGTGTGVFDHASVRSISVVRPLSYNDVSTIAASVRAGAIVVLHLRSVDEALMKRVLDFSFGVASALDAKVDHVSDRVFTIVRGQALTDEERTRVYQEVI